jgi:hypothetical protein
MPPESRGRMGLFRRLLDQRHAGSTPRWAETVSRCLTIDDLRQLMEHRVPPVVTDYFVGGAGSEQTMRDNVEAFARRLFSSRDWGGPSTRDQEGALLHAHESLPELDQDAEAD